MKYLRTITIFSVLIIIAGGCDFLNETPTAHQSKSNFYKTASDAEVAISDVYRQAHLIARYWYAKTVFGDIRSDDAVKGGGSASDNPEARRLGYFVPQATNGEVGNAWSYNYRGVYLANLVLAKVPDIKMDAKKKANILAQAHFWRGYFYFQLVRLFGNIPLIKKPLKQGNFNQPQVKSSKIWPFIIQDADSAASNLPTNQQLSSSQLGRITKGAAETLKLNVYMWLKKWKEAQKLGDQIINGKFGRYSLDPDYDHMLSLEGEFGSGSIFEINMETKPGKGVGNEIPVWEASRDTWGIGFVCPTQDLVDAFEKGDPRLKATVIFNGESLPEGQKGQTGPSPTGYYSRKYWLPPSERPQNNGSSDLGQAPTNERIYRLAGVMLWDAEASVHNGDIANATKLVNKVRARARHSGDNKDSSVLPAYSSVTLQDVYHEERVEEALGGGHRRFYALVRTDRAATVFHAFAKKYNTEKGANYKKGVSNLIPIPQQEIDLSDGKLKQNSGY